jgi:LmbE family N-acetylglucosaminyl deacetylase
MFIELLKKETKTMAIFAHPDDAELICGGTLLKLSEFNSQIKVICVSDEDGLVGLQRQKEAKMSASLIGAEIEFLSFRDGFLVGDKTLHTQIGNAIRTFRPHIVLSHNFHVNLDHQDHITVGKVTSIEARKIDSVRCILLGSMNKLGNAVVDVSKYYCQRTDLLSIFATQKSKWYMSADNQRAFLSYTPYKTHSDEQYFESFFVEYIQM